jgi:1-acyl-sn-glycerol-3-phosphate acyltransferase
LSPWQREQVVKLVKALAGEDDYRWLDRIAVKDLGFGYDLFGLEKETAALAYLFARLVYKHWFRVESDGHHNIPRVGRCILAGNHGGMLPWDAAMACVDTIARLHPPRFCRSIVDNFVADIPFLNVFFARIGQVIGARQNFKELLANDELVIVFPEGTPAIGKTYRERYRLRPFRVGFVELALQYQAPIVPVAFVGPDEQAPILFRLDGLARGLGLPFVPVTPTFPLLGLAGLLPLPVKYRIRYGEPLHFYREHPKEAARNPRLVEELADQVRARVQEMVDAGVKSRRGTFV